MMDECVLSVVTISRNDRQGLEETLASVCQQDYPYIEHIVVDGDSDDGSKELLSSYAHSKTYTYRSEPDRGISDAFNKGLERSNGHLIFFLNAGDVFVSSQVVSTVIRSYLEHRWQCAEGMTLTSSYSGQEILYAPPKLPSWCLRYLMFLPHQGFFCETALHKPFRFDESIKVTMDYDLFIRMLKGIEIFYLPFAIAKREPGGISSRSDLRTRELATIRRQYARSILDQWIIRFIDFLTWVKAALKVDSPFARKQTL
jgi:putative colanic acid biosynthesis glycosyltransferase